MPRQAIADWNAADQAPEYPPGAGAKTSTDAHSVIEAATEARQGVTGHNVNVVLALSLAAVIVAFAAIYVAFWS